MLSNVAIIGSGPAGYTAAIYAARSGLKPALITGELVGGQLLYTSHIQNFPGAQNVSGFDLVESFARQAQELGVQTINEKVTAIDVSSRPFSLQLSSDEELNANSIIIATGALPRWLNVEGEEQFKGKGISVCATCDGYFYKGQKVAVIGGGNTALYEALFLSTLAEKVVLINREAQLAGESSLRQEVQNNPKIEIMNETIVTSFTGSDVLTGIWLKNTRTLEVEHLGLDGAFVAIGQVPNTGLFQGLLDMDETGYIKVDHDTKQTSVAGIFAAGDVQERIFRQAIIACGSGAIAALSAEKYLLEKK